MIDATAPAGKGTIFSHIDQVKATERPRGKLQKGPSGWLAGSGSG
jgi:hypothetical protein